MTKKFTTEHVWLEFEAGQATVGITQHAQETLGDIVFVELPEIGRKAATQEVVAVVESVKAAADVYMPVDGTVTAVNEALRADPALANSDPLGAGWFLRIKLHDQAQLNACMDEAAYQEFLANNA